MSKPEVQPLVTFIFGRPQILVLLSIRHGIPNAFSSLISPYVVPLDENCHHHVPTNKCKENFVSPSVQRLVIITIDLCVSLATIETAMNVILD